MLASLSVKGFTIPLICTNQKLKNMQGKTFTFAALLLALISSIFFTKVNAQINHPHFKWKFESGAPIRGAVRADQGKLYFGNSAGIIFCIDQTSAREIWRFDAGGAMVSQPLVSEGKVIFQARSSKVFALDASKGSIVWTFEFGKPSPHPWGWDYYDASPVVAGNNLLLGTGDNNLYALGINDGKLAWKFSSQDKIRATPHLAGNKLYLSSYDGFLYLLNPSTGKLENKYETDGVKLYTQLVGWDRTALVTRPALLNNNVVFGSRDGGLYCLDVNTLDKKWRFTYGASWVGSSPAIDGNSVYVGWSDALVISAHDMETGQEKWKFNGGSYFYSTPVVDTKNVYIGAFNGKVYAFDKEKGTVTWEYQTGGAVLSSPVLIDGVLYIGSDSGSLYAIENGPKTHLAVYHPEINAQKDLITSDKIAPYLQNLGYSRLDTSGLVQFIKARIADKSKSTLVFAHQYLPKEVIGKSASESLLKQYMEAGGKVLWLGYFPGYWVTNKDLRIVAIDEKYSAELLDVDFDVHMDFGTYYATTTREGVEQGLPKDFEALGSPISGGKGIVPLAINEFGRVASLWKPFGNNGGGFVLFCSWSHMPIQEKDLEAIRKIAEFGL